jgi:hypothetical protein
MTLESEVIKSVRDRIVRILNEEERDCPDWKTIGELSNLTVEYIEKFDKLFEIDEYWYKFLEDWEIRQVDGQYGAGQRAQLRKRII